MEQAVITIKGVGEVLARSLERIGIRTVHDLLLHLPREYIDYGNLQNISAIMPGNVTICAQIRKVTSRYVRRGMHITQAEAFDATGSVRLVWFNQSYRAAALKPGQLYQIHGPYTLRSGRFAIENPSITVEVAQRKGNQITPVYRESRDLTSAQIRRIVVAALSLPIVETLPDWIISRYGLLSLGEAFCAIHAPQGIQDIAPAKKRLAFEELFQLVLAASLAKQQIIKQVAPVVPFQQQMFTDFVQTLPYKLTDAQRRVIWQVVQDMQKATPMNRLVEGDVGSGKTLVAVMSGLSALAAGQQVALLAPTEVLARQHADSVYRLLDKTPFAGSVGLLVGSMKLQEKKRMRQAIADRHVRFVVGTQALLQESVDLSRVALVIVDEQHRFGVEQRRLLQVKAHHAPHILTMTATPIPRSLALTVFGELDISILDQLPPGRTPITTKIWSPNSRPQLYAIVDEQIAAGHQAFVVCPLIDDSQVLKVKSAADMYAEIQKKLLPHRRCALLHGRMKAEEKDAIMQSFAAGNIDVLVSTTVIEVGVDVPNATVMVIEGADRFGLAQMHQLRGRVGRGGSPGYCYIVPSDSSAPSKRLRAIEQSTDGFALAELDLEIRGPGAIYGTRQSGELDLRIARFDDVKLIAMAREAAALFIEKGENLLQYQQLSAQVTHFQKVITLN